MINCTLQSLYLKQVEESPTSIERAVKEYLASQKNPSKDIAEECLWQETLFSEDKIIENWKQLLTVNLLCDLNHLHLSEINIKVRQFERHPWNKSSQYFRSLVALNHALAKMPIPEVGPNLLQSGAGLIDLYEYSPWLSIPYTPYHLEFGIFLCLLSLMTKRRDWEQYVLQLTNWQINTLDPCGSPFRGLFVREQESKKLQNLCITYLLFRSAALLNQETYFGAVADTLMKKLDEYPLEQEKERIQPLWPLIENWIMQYQQILPSVPFSISEQVYDPSTALVGYRTAQQYVVCTLHGGHTGLGVYRHGDVEIVTYGPQYLPLGESQGFGIEGNALSDQGMRRSIIEGHNHLFRLKGCTRLVDQPTDAQIDGGMFRGIWIEVEQEFKKPNFSLKTNFLGLDGWDSVAFSFYVKSLSCQMQSEQILFPGTLERYEGNAQSIILKGQLSKLELKAVTSFRGTMQVIPLPGGNHFWGANFLIAYLLNSDQHTYEWRLGPS